MRIHLPSGVFLRDVLKFFRESLVSLLPVIAVIVFFQVFIFQSVPDNLGLIISGIIVVWIGLSVFLIGLQYGIFPIGTRLTDSFTKKGNTPLILLFGFLVGFATTVAEPALFVIAEKAAMVSGGRIDANTLRYVVAFSVGFAVLTGVWRIIKGFPLHYIIMGGYLLVMALTYVTPKEIIGLSYDLGGVTTSTITVPLIAALGIGLASAIKGRNPMIDGFGIIALASLTPIIFVKLYGIWVYTMHPVDAPMIIQATTDAMAGFSLDIHTILTGFFRTVRDVLPIILIIFFFQYAVLKKKIPMMELLPIVAGLWATIFGLYAFVLGLEIGLIRLGTQIALDLTQLDGTLMIYIFALFIGFSTSMAEPAVMTVSQKASEISDGRIKPIILRIFVAIGVGIGLTLGAHRIIVGDSIQYYIMAGYAIVILLTYFAPRHIIPIAYDSGGVTTSTITVPLIAALGLGLASNIAGRDVMLDGFGLIAFACLFPIISVLSYAIAIEWLHKRKEGENTIE